MANPKENSVLELIYQVVAKLVRTFDLQNNYLDTDNSWADILAATAFVVQSMYHTTSQVTTVQIVFCT